MNFIEHIHEPSRLLLVWQGAEGSSRTRHVVAELLRVPNAPTQLRYLTDTEGFKAAQREGFESYPAFRKCDQIYEVGVVETFLRRLPPRKREDYGQYLEQFRLKPEQSISDFALLAYTGAKLPGDGFSIINPLQNLVGTTDVLLEVAGFRYKAELLATDLQQGMAVRFVPEPGNVEDTDAVGIFVTTQRIGYVVRQQAEAVRTLLNKGGIHACVERINGRPERPLVYLLARIHAPAAVASTIRAA